MDLDGAAVMPTRIMGSMERTCRRSTTIRHITGLGMTRVTTTTTQAGSSDTGITHTTFPGTCICTGRVTLTDTFTTDTVIHPIDADEQRAVGVYHFTVVSRSAVQRLEKHAACVQ